MPFNLNMLGCFCSHAVLSYSHHSDKKKTLFLFTSSLIIGKILNT